MWPLHHQIQPTDLHATSIALINSIAMSGGFFGPARQSRRNLGAISAQSRHNHAAPLAVISVAISRTTPTQVLLGVSYDRIGPICPEGEDCFTAWASGCVLLGGIVLGVAALVCVSRRHIGLIILEASVNALLCMAPDNQRASQEVHVVHGDL